MLRTELSDSQKKINDHVQKADSLAKILFAHQQKYQCENLYASGRVMDAARILLEIVRTLGGDVKADTIIMEWISGGFPRLG